jgi:hypothetical protein
MLRLTLGALATNSFVTLSIVRTAAKRNRRRQAVANSIDAEFTVAKEQAAIAHKAGDDE